MKPLLLAVLAVVMPTSGVLKRYAANRDGLHTSAMRAEGVLSVSPVLARELAPLLGVEWTSGQLELDATLSLRLPGRCRLDVTTPLTTKTLVVAVTNGAVRTEGGEVTALTRAVEEACQVLAVKNGDEGATREALLGTLHGLKVETKHISLARIDDSVQKVSYRIGDEADGAPQLWLFKEDFLPSRLRFADPKGQGWTIDFADYGSQATFDVWPRVLEVKRGAEPQLRLMMLRADLKADLSATKF